MCVFCGGQCGGAGEFLISMGLPLLALYFFRIKGFLLRMKDKILGRPLRAGAAPGPAQTCACCGQPQSACSPQLSPVKSEVPLVQLDELELAASPGPDSAKPQEKKLGGVRGWLLLLCLNLLLLIPAFSLYQTSCNLTLLASPQARILLLVWSRSYYYLNLASMAVTLFIALFSFYSGLQLWNIKEGAVKIAKKFLVAQLSLTLVLLALQQIIRFHSGGVGVSFEGIMAQLLPPLLYFSVWYAYLVKSRRVQQTYAGPQTEPWRALQANDSLGYVREGGR